jgi:hypothetical protein
MGVGMPQDLLLHEFGSQVWFAFGHPPYLVGSALAKKTGWRDVDVRLILPDDEWQAAGYGDPSETHVNGKWVAMCLAFSALGKQMTGGLPIDFQIQQQTQANKEYPENRSALCRVPLRMAKKEESNDQLTNSARAVLQKLQVEFDKENEKPKSGGLRPPCGWQHIVFKEGK